jgi:hypothetical protein
MTAPTLLADSTEPNLIPRRFAQQPNGVMGYFNGDYAWPPGEFARWPRWTRIGVRPLRLDPAAATVRELDVERGDASPADFPPFYQARKRPNHNAQAICYCDRSTVPLVAAALLRQLGQPALDGTLWHIAAPGWTAGPAALLAEIVRLYGGPKIDLSMVWAIQDRFMGTYDVSTVYGQPRWV